MTMDALGPLVKALQAAGEPNSEVQTRLAAITGTSGTSVLVQFDGESVASTRPYKRLASYTPTNGDRVLMLRSGSTWVCTGKLA